VRELRSQSSKRWRDLASGGDLVLTSNGKPIALLTAVAENNLEESLAAMRRARAIAAVERMQSQSLAAGKDRLSHREIEGEIALVRRQRRR
jgi:antitoxin (DNA-binding transcriptional repressor) of toxin-antitoxin stability system